MRDLKGAPVPGSGEAVGDTADALGVRSLGPNGGIDLDSGCVAAGAVAILSAGPHLLPLAVLGEAAIAGPLQLALRMEQGVLVEPHLPLGVLPAEDSTALSAVVTTVEEAEWRLAG